MSWNAEYKWLKNLLLRKLNSLNLQGLIIKRSHTH